MQKRGRMQSPLPILHGGEHVGARGSPLPSADALGESTRLYGRKVYGARLYPVNSANITIKDEIKCENQQ